MFDDKTYDELDDISKLMEPYRYSVNDVLSTLPDETVICFDDILLLYANSPSFNLERLTVSDLIAIKLNTNNLCVRKFYKLEIEDSGHVPTHIDFEKRILVGQIKLIKTNNGYSDKEMHELIVDYTLSAIRIAMYSPSSYDKKNANELAALFDIKGINSERGTKAKRGLLARGFERMFRDNKICIHDVDLGKRFARWIKLFLIDGNLGAIRNLCRLKIVSHKKHAIYSIQDEVEL